ncbi:MAG: hypothetical protein A2W33_07375 [Chloroflexi bacterium RBG_16_52_11]|nr:MAG: hypothetical protein A2W33_07375 [Chloroflexi bacterium RBG_16_52_11]
MKIVAVLETDCFAGGGFNQALNAIVQMQRICRDRFDFGVTTNLFKNVDYLAELGIKAELHKYGFLDRMLPVIRKTWVGSRLATRMRLVGTFERSMEQKGIDLVYFVMPSATPGMLQHLNYMFTIWDLCHRDFPEFPEVRGNGVFQEREAMYRACLSPAFLVLTESRLGAEAAARRYGLDLDRTLAMPLSPASSISLTRSASLEEVMSANSLVPGYYFYPAQLWAHKNHVRVLDATAHLRNQGIVRQVVFAGGDKGLGEHLRKRVVALKLENQVRLLGFVPSDHMRGLYDGCAAVVMPTYFGPTNIPPLEAWSIGRPLIYSSHLAEQVGDAALLANPDDEISLARAMMDVLDPSVARSLVEKGVLRLRQIEEQRHEAEQELLVKLQTFEKRRQCWN